MSRSRRFSVPAAAAAALLSLVAWAPGAEATTPTCDGRTATWVGTEGNDTFTDTAGAADVIVALGGNDLIDAGAGDDVICAGAGNDVVVGGLGSDRVFGEGGNDFLYGVDGPDAIFGGDGDDVIEGGFGSDQIFGEAGFDELWGGSCIPSGGLAHFCRLPEPAGAGGGDPGPYAALFDSTRLLRLGTTGADVTALQQLLTFLGYAPGPADGIFGSRTYSAVRAFQSAAALTVDGVVGAQTRAALAQALGSEPGEWDFTPPPGGSGSAGGDLGSRLLRLGTRGSDVAVLQALLTNLGFSPGPIDGIFGSRTYTAVRAFQAAHGLVVDGVVGPQTKAALLGDSGAADALDGGADFDTCNSPDTGTGCESRRGLRAGAPMNAAAAEEWRGVVTQAFTERGLEAEIENALAIVACESLADPFITTPSNLSSPEGTYVIGLFQHKSTYWAGRASAAGIPGASVYDPLANARVAAFLVAGSIGTHPHGPWGHWNGCGPLVLDPPAYIP